MKTWPPGRANALIVLGSRKQVEVEVLHVGALAGVAVADETPADLVDEGRARVLAGIDVAAHLAGHLGRGLEAQGHLLVDAHRDVLLLSRHRIDLGVEEVHPEADERDHQRTDQAADGQPPAPLVSRIIAVRHLRRPRGSKRSGSIAYLPPGTIVRNRGAGGQEGAAFSDLPSRRLACISNPPAR